jgi:hypothetical protein
MEKEEEGEEEEKRKKKRKRKKGEERGEGGERKKRRKKEEEKKVKLKRKKKEEEDVNSIVGTTWMGSGHGLTGLHDSGPGSILSRMHHRGLFNKGAQLPDAAGVLVGLTQGCPIPLANAVDEQ